jgi:cysteine synthase A
MIVVDDAESIGAMRAAAEVLGRRVGGSTGTNLWASLELAREMAARNETGSIVTLLCDAGERYSCTYYDDDWLAARNVGWHGPARHIAGLLGAADTDGQAAA